MKKIYLTIFLILFIVGLQAQTTIVCSENFNTGTLTGWTITPSLSNATWHRDSTCAVSAPSSFRGHAPQSDSVELISPIYDFRNYQYVFLKFNQICKISNSDISRIEYKELSGSSKWNPIPRSSYKGAGIYFNNNCFNQNSYNDWQPNDSLAIPTNSWWKTESFDISQEVSYVQVQFRFIIKKSSVIGSQFTYGWLIDDFEIIASNHEIIPPIVEFISPLVKDTIYNMVGPFVINAKVATRTTSPILPPVLRYVATYNNVTTIDSLIMSKVVGDSIWTATIPQHVYGTAISYAIYATDSFRNTNSAFSNFYIKKQGISDSNSIALKVINNPINGVLVGNQPVHITIKNKGFNNLTSATINWKVNGVLQPSKIYTGNLPEDFTDTVTVGYYTQRTNFYDTIIVWVSMPNGHMDTNTTDDTLTTRAYGCNSFFHGIYTVGDATADFVTLNDFFTIVNICGMDGPVTLQFKTGTYAPLSITSIIPGSNDTNTITFTSEAGNADSVIFSAISTNTTAITLQNTAHLIFDKVTLNAVGGQKGIQFTGSCEDIKIRYCHILLASTVTSTAYAGIYKANNTGIANNIDIHHNNIEGGYYNIYWYAGTSSSYGNNINIDSNILSKAYQYATYLYYNNINSLSYNIVSSRTANIASNWYGFYIRNNNINNIIGNKIFTNTSINNTYGIYTYSLNINNNTYQTIIANNEIRLIASSSNRGIYLYQQARNIDLIHNSVYLTGTASTIRGLDIGSNVSSLQLNNNNIVCLPNISYPLYISSIPTVWNADYNNYYAPQYIGYYNNTNINSLSAWQQATTKDANSVSINPVFIDSSQNLELSHLTSTGLECPLNGQVLTDINGNSRKNITYMGAYSLERNAKDIMPYVFLSPTKSQLIGNNTPVKISVLSRGSDTVTNMQIGLIINGITQTPLQWTGILMPFDTTQIVVGSFIPQSGNNTITVFTYAPNGLQDENINNDTLTTIIYGCDSLLHGIYTIGDSTAFFVTLNDFINSVNLCGIDGPVTLQFKTGTYAPFSITSIISGSNDTNTITFTSEAGNVDSVIFSAISTNTTAITLQNTAHLIFDKVTLNAVGGQKGIQFTGNCEDIEIRYCHILLDSTVTSTAYAGIYKADNTGMANNIDIHHNNIEGGYYNIYWYAGTSSSYGNKINIDSNILSKAYQYATYLYYNNINSLSYNIVSSRTADIASDWYGFYVRNNNINNIIGNKIFTNTSINNTYGIYMVSLNVNDTNYQALIANNEVRLTASSSNRGTYLDQASHIDFIHNSVYLTGTASTIRGLDIGSNISSLQLNNNNIVCLLSASYPIYISSLPSVWNADYNNYYAPQYIGYYNNTDHLSLSAWQQATNKDTHSVNINPVFIDSTQSLELSSLTPYGLECPLTMQVLHDINGVPRKTITYMGAYLLERKSIDIMPYVFLSPIKSQIIGNNSPIKITVANVGNDTITSMYIGWKVNGVQQTSVPWNGILLPLDTIQIVVGSFIPQSGNNTIAVFTYNPNALQDENVNNDTLTTTVYACSSLLHGIYTIGNSTADFVDFNNFLSVVNLCGMDGPVTLQFKTGTYAPLSITSIISGSNDTNTITFTSEAGYPDSVIFVSTNATSLSIENTAHLIFDKLSFDAVPGDGIEFTGNCDNIEIRYCNINSSLAGISNRGSVLNDINIHNNHFLNTPNYCIDLDCYWGYNLTIDSNIFEGESMVAIGVSRANINSISYNIIATQMTGIELYNTNPKNIIGNKIHMDNSNGYLISIDEGNTNNPNNHTLIANNEIISINSGDEVIGMDIYVARNMDIIHNSIYLMRNGSPHELSSGIYLTNIDNCNVKNNNIVVPSIINSYYSIYMRSFGGTFSMTCNIDYNNYSYPAIADNGTYYYSLSAWQQATGQDMHSVSVNPIFIDSSQSLELLNYTGLGCSIISSVGFDIRGFIRAGNTTYMGAYTQRSFTLDAALVDVMNWNLSYTAGQSIPVNISLMNLGKDTLKSANIHWIWNGVTQTTSLWSGTLNSYESDTIYLGTVNPIKGINTLSAWITNPNAGIDSNTTNDTIIITTMGCDSLLHGIYTVGDSTANFINFNDFLATVNLCAIDGPVTLKFKTGIYTPLSITSVIPGSSDTNTITFTSEAGHPDSVIFVSTNATSLSIGNTAHLIFDKLSFNTVAGTYGVEFTGNCEDMEIGYCKITSSSDGIYNNNSAFVLNDVTIHHNTIYSSGTSNINLYVGWGNNLIIDSNILNGAFVAIRVKMANINSISYNTMISPVGLDLSNTNTKSIFGNKIIYKTIYDDTYAMFIDYLNTNNPNNHTLIANNEIISLGFTLEKEGIDLMYSKNVNIIHNSIYLENQGSSQERNTGFYLGDIDSLNIKNNIIVIPSSSAFSIHGGNCTRVQSDYNNYSNPSIYLNGVSSPPLSAWQQATGQDMHSVSINPIFIDSSQSLELADYTGLSCPTISDVPSDIRGIIRAGSTSMGAYTQHSISLDAALIDVINWNASNTIGQSIPVNVSLMNMGKDTLKSVSIYWTWNGVTQTVASWTGTLKTFERDTILIGNVYPIKGINTLSTWVTNPNAGIDSNTTNDTIVATTIGCDSALSGIYTIGTVTSDFASLNDFMTAINNCGIKGPIILNFATGTYDSLSLGSIPNTNATNTITITSMAANSDSVIFRSMDVALSLSGAKYLRFEDVTFDAINGTYGIQFIGSCKNIEIRNCHILANPVTTSNNYAGIYKASGSTVDSISIIHNMIDGGYYNIYFVGNSSSVYNNNILIDSNIMTNAYYYATYFNYNNITSCSYNTLSSRSVNIASNWYGLNISYNNINNIIGNKVSTDTVVNNVYGIYVNYMNEDTNYQGLIANNEIRLTATSTNRGIYLSQIDDDIDLIHNSVYLAGTASTIRGLEIGSGVSSLQLKNNNIVCLPATSYPVYVSSIPSVWDADYNNYYAPQYIGKYNNVDISSLSVWQSTTSQDTHAVNIYPIFIDTTINLDVMPLGLICPLNPKVQKDINGMPRNSITIIGAYSSLFDGIDLKINDIVSPVNQNTECYSDFMPVIVKIGNIGRYTADFKTHPLALHVEITGAISFQADTLISVDTLAFGNIATFTIHNMFPSSNAGIHNIKVWLSCALDTVKTNDTLFSTFYVNKINLPYEEDFSNIPQQITFNQIHGNTPWIVSDTTGIIPSPVFGKGCLAFNAGIASISQALLQSIDLRNTSHPVIRFWYAHDNNNPYYNDQVIVKISTDGGLTFTTINTVYRYDNNYTTPTWVMHEIDLSSYTSSSCVKIMLEALSYGGGNQYIDRISITAQQDIAISLLVPKQDDLTACDLDNNDLRVVVTNLTSQVVDFTKDTTQIEVKVSGADTVSFTYPLTGKLQSMAKDTFLISNAFNLSNNGTYNLIAYFNAIDSNFVNDTSKYSILIHPDVMIKDIVGVDEVNCKNMGDSVYVSFKIINNGNLAVEEIPVRLQINGINDISEILYTSLEPGDSTVYAFTEPYIVPIVSDVQPYYVVKVQTEISCDAITSNNIKEIIACVEIPKVVDLKIQSINTPIANNCDTGLHTVHVSVSLSNAGTNNITDAILYAKIDSAGINIASFSEVTNSISAGSTLEHIFTQGYKVPNFNGNYTVKVYVKALVDDKDLSNDTLEVNACAIYNDVSTNSFNILNWTLGQNIPNPAQNIIELPYSIPQDGEINLKIITINGQILYQNNIQSTAGKHSIKIEVTNLSSGIYYYSMKYQGQLIVKKMTICK